MISTIAIFTTHYLSPVGWLKISVSENAVHEILFCDEQVTGFVQPTDSGSMQLMEIAVKQLDEYFTGKRKNFDLPLSQAGTVFQQRVWQELMEIPYGATISYLQLSRRLGNVKAIRAAASTNGKNRIAILVPCHRVIGSNQQLVGYAGGLSKKKWLLEHESKFAHGKQTLF